MPLANTWFSILKVRAEIKKEKSKEQDSPYIDNKKGHYTRKEKI